MVFLDLFLSLGFIGYYTVYALFIGAIAVFGLIGKLKLKPGPILKQISTSWFVGYFLISISPIGSIIIAVIIRLVGTGAKSAFVFKDDAEIPVKISNKGIGLIVFPIALLIILSLISQIFSPPLQLEWYNVNDVEIIQLTNVSSVTLNEIQWDDIKDSRIVSQEYALQLPKTLITETGWRLSYDWDGIYPINNTLYWIMAYEPDKLINYARDSPAYIIVNAQNPIDRRKIEENIPFSEERSGFNIFYQLLNGGIRDVSFKLWFKYPFLDYGDTIFTHDDDGNSVWFAPAKLSLPTAFITTFYIDQVGIVTLTEDGSVTFYSNEEIRNGNAPNWLENQILIDEDYSEIRIDRWAKYNNWEGFIDYTFQHENVFELAQDLYFQYDKEENRNFALLQLEPEGASRKSITHFVEIESSTTNFGKITIFDTRTLSLIGPKRAIDGVRGQISLYSDWYPLQPIFKNIKDSYFYVIPVYSGFRESMVLKAVAVVDAKTEQVKLFNWEDVKSGIVYETSDEEEPVKTNQTISDEGCSVISTELVNGKTRIIIECE